MLLDQLIVNVTGEAPVGREDEFLSDLHDELMLGWAAVAKNLVEKYGVNVEVKD